MTASDAAAERCVEGITADRDRARRYAATSIGLATLLKPVIGYEKSSELGREAVATGWSAAELAIERGLITAEDLDRLLAPEALDPDGAPSD